MGYEKPLILESYLTCPNCKNTTLETMPENACVRVFDCAKCEFQIRPKAGDCCVFCSYGSSSCPPRQQEGLNCC